MSHTPDPLPSGTAPSAAPHPLIAELFSRHGFAEVTADNFEAFTQAPGHTLLLFTEDPVRYRETLDLAVITPELARALPGRFRVGVLLPGPARAFHSRYNFRRWPAYVILRDGRYVGAIEGMHGWEDFLARLSDLLAAPPASDGDAMATAGPPTAGDRPEEAPP